MSTINKWVEIWEQLDKLGRLLDSNHEGHFLSPWEEEALENLYEEYWVLVGVH